LLAPKKNNKRKGTLHRGPDESGLPSRHDFRQRGYKLAACGVSDMHPLIPSETAALGYAAMGLKTQNHAFQS